MLTNVKKYSKIEKNKFLKSKNKNETTIQEQETVGRQKGAKI